MKPNAHFQNLLAKSPFRIFEAVSDLGFYSWRPTGAIKQLAEVTCDDIKALFLSLRAKPKRALSAELLNKECPKAFRYDLQPQEHDRQFPYHPSYLPPLYVAVADRKVPLRDIDFIFGGSVLDMLARCRTTGISADSLYLAKLVPGSNTVVVGRYCNYTQDYTVPGFQFEHFATGGEFDDRHDHSVTTHLHIMKVGKYNVLFPTETDAVDAVLHDCPIEIKTSSPWNWGTHTVFQMLSAGSVSILGGKKEGDTLQGVHELSLTLVTVHVLKGQHSVVLERRILTAMDRLRDAMCSDQLSNGNVLELFFDNGAFKWRTFDNPESALLPPDHVVGEMLRYNCGQRHF